MPKFVIKIGPKDFEGIQCDLDERRPDTGPSDPSQGSLGRKQFSSDKEVQPLVVKTFLFLIIVALAVAFGLSVALGSWTPLVSVWLIVAAPLGVLFDRYVGKPYDKIRAA
jgi:hypothetical protein